MLWVVGVAVSVILIQGFARWGYWYFTAKCPHDYK